MKGYKQYKEVNYNKLFDEYLKTNITQTELCKKYNIPYPTFNNRYVKWKNLQMAGGENIRNITSDKTEYKKSETKKREIKHLTDTEEPKKSIIKNDEDMRNMFNPHIGGNKEKKTKEEKQHNNKNNTQKLDDVYNITGFLNEQNKKKSQID